MHTENINFKPSSSFSQQLNPTAANSTTASNSLNSANSATSKANFQPEVQQKLSPEQQEKLQEQAKALEMANRKTLLESMFAKGEQGDAKALRIFYQEAAFSIEKALKEELGADFSLENLIAQTSGKEGQEDYWSSENTAERIMIGATSYFETFRKQNPRLSDEELVERYVNLISPALAKGIGEAKDILEGFGALNGHVKDTVAETERLVFEKLEAFREQMLNKNKAEEEKPLFGASLIDDSNAKEAAQL